MRTSRFDPANCINLGLCQNNFEWRWHSVCLPCQDNLKNLTDTESDDENLYICIVEPPGSAYILAKVFSRCPESKSGKFYEKDDDETLRSALVLSRVVFNDQLHIVECGVSVVFISHRSFQNLDSMVRSGSTLLLYKHA